MSASLSLATLVAAVRSSKVASRIPESWSDADIADLVRTASSEKGAVWLVTRALPAEAASQTTVQGRWDTAIRCLRLLAADGDALAVTMLDAYAARLAEAAPLAPAPAPKKAKAKPAA